jgi:hypothetical protein
MAIKSTDQRLIARAMKVLEKGYDLSLALTSERKAAGGAQNVCSSFRKDVSKDVKERNAGVVRREDGANCQVRQCSWR